MSNHIIECADNGEVGYRNTGFKEICLEGSEIRDVLAPKSQEFATKAVAVDLDNWKTARDAKELFPLFEIDDLANANTDDTLKELRQRTIVTAKGKTIITYNAYISLCMDYALRSFHNKKMRRYSFTDAQEILGVSPDGVKVRGELVTVEVLRRVRAVADSPAYTPVRITIADDNERQNGGVVLRPDWSHIEFDGIFDATIVKVSATSSSIKFKVLTGCGSGNEAVTTLEDGDVILKNASGVTQSPTFVEADANGVYEFTGTGFTNNFTISLNGVVAKAEASYEGVAALTITGIS